MHLYDLQYLPALALGDAAQKNPITSELYRQSQLPLYGFAHTIRANIITMPDTMHPKTPADCLRQREASTVFLCEQLEKEPEWVGEALVLPTDSDAAVRALLRHPRIRGFKCYHTYAKDDPTWQAEIGSYLPESAWRIAEENGLVITLHMVRDDALSDGQNLAYILAHARCYPHAKLILAHAARGFAAWTTIDSAGALTDLNNVFCDVAAVCEAPAVCELIKRIGTDRILWGSDFPISMRRGKCISIGDRFLWLYQEQLEKMNSRTPFAADLIGLENLLMLEQAAQLMDLSRGQVEDIFYNNAMRLFRL